MTIPPQFQQLADEQGNFAPFQPIALSLNEHFRELFPVTTDLLSLASVYTSVQHFR